MVMAEAMEALGKDADKVTPVFITVDPARDRPEALKDYVANFHDRMVGLTGSEEQVAAAAEVYKARYVRLDDDDGDDETYFVGHTATTYLVGPDGAQLTTFAHETGPVEMAEAIRGYLD
jgi:protein SCO1/2